MGTKILASGSTLEKLKDVLDGTPFTSGSALEDGDVLVVCAHGATSGTRQPSATGGLEQLDHLLADPDFSLPPVLILSFQTPAQHLTHGLRNSIGSRRGEAEGASLPCLEKTHLLARAARAREASMLTVASLMPFERLPVETARLKDRVDAAKVTRLEPWQEWLLRLEASRGLLSIGNATYRHGHKNLIAAVRIYLGALQAGTARIEDAEQILEQLAQKERQFTGSQAPAVNTRNIADLCRRHRTIVERVRATDPPEAESIEAEPWRTWLAAYRLQQGGVPPLRQDRSVLMLDDQCDASGWVYILDALAEDPASVVAVADWDAAKCLLPRRHFDLMLIDCNLGKDEATGLELLRPLREFSADLPIAMMTAYDDAELALWALRSGANDFYAKSLEDVGDRDSLDYSVRFSEVLERPRWENKLRRQWTTFRGALPLVPGSHDQESQTRYAFYLLFSLADRAAWWARGGTSLARESDVHDWICRTAILSIATAFPPEKRTVEYDIWDKARHPRRGDPVTISDAMVMLSFGVGNLCASSLGRTPRNHRKQLDVDPLWPPGCRIDREELLNYDPSKPEDDRRSRVKLGHLQRSSLGALQFVLGCCAAAGGICEAELSEVFTAFGDDFAGAMEILKSYYPNAFPLPMPNNRPGVVLIDDEGDTNGWYNSLSFGLGEQVGWYSSLANFLQDPARLEDTDVVLLDLWLSDTAGTEPAAETGLLALRELKARDPGLPVIVLSAGTDAVNAIRCMKLGALDYVAKWLPDETDMAAWERFSGGLKSRITAASQLGRSKFRGAWRTLARGLQAAPESGPMAGPPDSQEPLPDDWLNLASRGFLEHILPAMVLYTAFVTERLLRGEVPSLDAWRVRRVLLTQGDTAEEIALLAGRAAEYLGWVTFCLNRNEIASRDVWKASPNYWEWIEAASRSANTLWNYRNWVRDPETPRRPRGWHPDAEHTIDLALQCLDEFKQNIEDGRVYVA